MEMQLPLRYAVYDTAVGDVTLVANEKRLVALLFGSKDPAGCINEENTALYDGIIEINQYAYGQRETFDLKYEIAGDKESVKVYEWLLKSKYGETIFLDDVCAKFGLTRQRAMEILIRNPLPIIIPSHRVIDSPEDVGRLAGCDSRMYEKLEDKELKKALLEVEQKRLRKKAEPEVKFDPFGEDEDDDELDI